MFKFILFGCILFSLANLANGNTCQNSYGTMEGSIDTVVGSQSPSLIPVDSANKMVLSYLKSINYTTTDSNVFSFVLNATDLKQILDTSTVPIVSLKVMLAHNLDYINSGHQNVNAGFNKNALTVVVVGVNAAGNYVIFPGGSAYDRSMPCPSSCPQGSASNPIIQ